MPVVLDERPRAGVGSLRRAAHTEVFFDLSQSARRPAATRSERSQPQARSFLELGHFLPSLRAVARKLRGIRGDLGSVTESHVLDVGDLAKAAAPRPSRETPLRNEATRHKDVSVKLMRAARPDLEDERVFPQIGRARFTAPPPALLLLPTGAARRALRSRASGPEKFCQVVPTRRELLDARRAARGKRDETDALAALMGRQDAASNESASRRPLEPLAARTKPGTTGERKRSVGREADDDALGFRAASLAGCGDDLLQPRERNAGTAWGVWRR